MWLLCPVATMHQPGVASIQPSAWSALHRSEYVWDAYQSSIAEELSIVKLFIDLVHCKNIGTKDSHPPKKINAKRVRRGKQPLFTYKTLIIKPTGKKQKAQAAQGLWDNRVHLCRGHFKEYTKEAPLFGRVTGRFWWQPSVRGNKKKGVVMKDYKVEVA